MIDGTGYSIVDGERVDWEKGDLVLLPLRPDGAGGRITLRDFRLVTSHRRGRLARYAG